MTVEKNIHLDAKQVQGLQERLAGNRLSEADRTLLAENKQLSKDERRRPKRNNNYIECYCNTHALRQFADIKDFFPQQCGMVLDIFSQLYEWASLTRFLHLPGVPLDNNTVERALKGIILLRKASLFFKNEHGAYVGSLLFSLIATCTQANINPVDYLVALQTYRSEVFRVPDQWLPWNYRQTMDRMVSAAA